MALLQHWAGIPKIMDGVRRELSMLRCVSSALLAYYKGQRVRQDAMRYRCTRAKTGGMQLEKVADGGESKDR